jgi:flavin reductase (DIM6/NTAB) family NADH-FMN oxidoreductase RutF
MFRDSRYTETASTAEQARQLRNAFGVYPTGVAVVTCMPAADHLIGVTANSFVSLSLQPPLVSIALHREARHVRGFLASGSFAVNVLGTQQKSLSDQFARPSACDWKSVRYAVTDSGHIVLNDAAAFFLCRVVDSHDVGDHVLLVGEIQRYGWDEDASPLVFTGGHYGAFQPAAEAPPANAVELWLSEAPISWG